MKIGGTEYGDIYELMEAEFGAGETDIETLEMFMLGYGEYYINAEEYYNMEKNIFTINLTKPDNTEETIYSGSSSSYYTVTSNGNYTFKAKNANGDIGAITVKVGNIIEEKYSNIYSSTELYTDENGDTAWIPKGFAVGTNKSKNIEIDTVENGLVITDKVDSEGNSIGNEFVWIPVEKAIVTESEIVKIIADSENPDMTPLKAVQSLVNSGTYPMAVQDGADYKGILYGFTHNSDNTLTLTVKDWTSKLSSREPKVLSGYDTQTNFTTYGLGTYSDDLYQNAYNQMVKSVAKNGGFYVGRYEISLYTDSENNAIKYAQTKKDQTALVSTTWYEMYKYERDYAKYNTNLGVTSEMMWGSQWDQMMIFVNGKNDGVGAKFYVAKAGSRKSGNSTTTTGIHSVDQVANIFDLEASRYEWTQESISSDFRVIRGGSYNRSVDASGRRFSNGYPTSSDSSFSSRASLYIK